MSLFAIAFSILLAFLKSKTVMATENLCLRQLPRRGQGKIVAIPILGGIHHRYERVAA